METTCESDISRSLVTLLQKSRQATTQDILGEATVLLPLVLVSSMAGPSLIMLTQTIKEEVRVKEETAYGFAGLYSNTTPWGVVSGEVINCQCFVKMNVFTLQRRDGTLWTPSLPSVGPDN